MTRMPDVQFQPFPGFVGGIDRGLQRDSQRQARAVSQRQAQGPRQRGQASGNPGVLGAERHGFANGTGGIFPSFVGGPPSLHQFGLHLGKIDGAANSAGEQRRGQFLVPGSPWMSARIAEASSTILFMLGCLAAFGKQFIDQ